MRGTKERKDGRGGMGMREINEERRGNKSAEEGKEGGRTRKESQEGKGWELRSGKRK